MKSVPRKNPIPQDEIAICQRLRQFRQTLGLSQLQFARRSGIGWRTYSNYELGRVKLSYSSAKALLTAFPKLNARWLAEGTGYMLGGPYFVTLPDPTKGGITSSDPFSFVYHSTLKHALLLSRSAWVNNDQSFPLFRVGDTVEGRVSGKALFAEIIGGYLEQVADGHVNSFLDQAQSAVQKAFDQTPKDTSENISKRAKSMLQLGSLQPPFAFSDDNNLTKAESPVVSGGTMKLQLPSLLDRLRKATSAPGKKTELAEALRPKVPLASVSRWLSGEREPGGEATLQLLRWVEMQERGTP